MPQTIFNTDDYPGWRYFPEFLSKFLMHASDFRALDLGGGANPMLRSGSSNGISCDLLDVDEIELSKAPQTYTRLICIDATIPEDKFQSEIGDSRYDLIFSHMFLEHIRDPDQLHKNVFIALKPGGHAVHAYPSNNNIPLGLNSMLPETISRAMVKFAQPDRDLEGRLGKFPAYYMKCYSPSGRAKSYFEDLGYEIVTHKGYAGHGYYKRIPVIRSLEKLQRRLAVFTQLPWISFNILVLKRPNNLS